MNIMTIKEINSIYNIFVKNINLLDFILNTSYRAGKLDTVKAVSIVFKGNYVDIRDAKVNRYYNKWEIVIGCGIYSFQLVVIDGKLAEYRMKSMKQIMDNEEVSTLSLNDCYLALKSLFLVLQNMFDSTELMVYPEGNVILVNINKIPTVDIIYDYTDTYKILTNLVEASLDDDPIFKIEYKYKGSLITLEYAKNYKFLYITGTLPQGFNLYDMLNSYIYDNIKQPEVQENK